jgi:hypothetical protein
MHRLPRPPATSALSCKATTLIAVLTAMTFAASGAAPTTLYQSYQETFGLTPFTLTVIFGAYVLSLLGAAHHAALISRPLRVQPARFQLPLGTERDVPRFAPFVNTRPH